MAEISKKDKKDRKDKRKSLSDLTATTSTAPDGKKARNTGVDAQLVATESVLEVTKKKKKGGEKVNPKADEIVVQPEPTKPRKTKEPVAEEKAAGESKPKKRKKNEEQDGETVGELATQPKLAKSTKAKQPTEETVIEGEPTQKNLKRRKKGEGNVGTVDEVREDPVKSAKAKERTVEATGAEEVAERKKSKKKGKKGDAKEDDTVKDIETPVHDPPTAATSGKKQKSDSASKPTIQAPITTKLPRKPTMATSETTTKKSKKAKAKAKDPSPEPAPPSDDDDDDVEGDVHFDSGEDDEVHLHGFSTDDDDSSDEEGGMDFEAAPLDITKLPTVAKDDPTVKRKLDKAKRQPGEDRGVLFIGRLPHGFYEDQLKAYFSQFGTVTRLRVSRNKKTGRSKHYAFLEFDSLAVAQIVADTMDNYLLMGHILRCKLIPKDEVHPELWIGANRKWRPVPRDRLTRVEHNKPRTVEEQARAAKRLIKRQNTRKRKLAEAGIGYDFDTVSYKKPKEAQV